MLAGLLVLIADVSFQRYNQKSWNPERGPYDVSFLFCCGNPDGIMMKRQWAVFHRRKLEVGNLIVLFEFP